MEERPWVLVTSGGGNGQNRSSVAAVRALGLGRYPVAVTCSADRPLAAASRYCLRRVDVPPPNSPGFASAVRDELGRRPYLTVLPSSDAELAALGAPVQDLINKAALLQRAQGAGLAAPPTRTFTGPEDLIAARAELPYPCVIKPEVSDGAWPAFRADGPAHLERPLGKGPFLVQPYLSEELLAVGGVVWDGRLVAAVHQRYLRTWPPDCGPSCAAETVPHDIDIEGRLLRLMAGYEGIFQAQFAGEFLLDVNPRVYGSLPLAVVAGANLPVIWCDLLQGKAVEPVRARPGVFYRWLEGDIRHLGRLLRAGELGPVGAARALAPRRGAVHSTESLSDPGPMLTRIRHLLRRAGRGHLRTRRSTRVAYQAMGSQPALSAGDFPPNSPSPPERRDSS